MVNIKMSKFIVIECPNCGKEYLPSEIFIPKNYFGVPKTIIRDPDGKIVDVVGTDMDLVETYTCDNCDCAFKVKSKVNFNATVDDSLNFDTDYERKVWNGLKLNEY